MAKDISVLNSAKEFEATYRKFLHLYERLAEDRVVANKQGETLGIIIEELKAESSLATEFKVQVRKGIRESVNKVMEEVDGLVKKSIQESVTKEINSSVKDFKSVIDNGAVILRDYTEDKKSRDIWIYFGVIFCGFIFLFSAYTAMKVYRYIPDSYLTGYQVETYSNGEYWNVLWRRMSKKDLGRITSLVMGSVPPEEGSYDWIKKENPKLSPAEVRKKYDEQKE